MPETLPLKYLARTKYWKQLAAFSYGSYREHGDGAVLIKEQPGQSFSSADLDKYFRYIPFDPYQIIAFSIAPL